MEMKAREALETHNLLGKVYMTMRNRQAAKEQIQAGQSQTKLFHVKTEITRRDASVKRLTIQ
jgi:hypothetical protein